MSIFDPTYKTIEIDTKLKELVLNRLTKDKFDGLSAHSPDELWFIQDSELSGQPIVVDTRPVEIPTKLSEFQNDVGYCTSAYVTSMGYATESWVNNKNYATPSYVQSYVADHASKTAWRDWFQTNWPSDAVTFTALSSDSGVSFNLQNSPPSVSLEYTTNGAVWNDLSANYQVTLQNVGDRVAIRAKTTNQRMASSWISFNYFSGVGALKISGNINSLLNKNPEEVTSLPDNAFTGLFYRSSSDSSFRDASELTLPATSLGLYCYCRLFYMATMLEKAPDLPATTLADNCYDYMFNRCASLKSIKIAYTGNFSGTGVPNKAFNGWVSGVAASGTLYYDGTDTTIGDSAIPTGWTVQTF